MKPNFAIGCTLAATVALASLGCMQPPGQMAPGGPAGGTPKAGVPLAALAAIKDPNKQQAAATLSTELGANLRVERAMVDADLLARAKPAAAYAILSADEEEKRADAGASPIPVASGAASTHDEDEYEDEDDEEEKAEKAAKAAWKKLSSEQRKLIKEALKGREAKLLAKLAKKLAKKEQAFKRLGADQVLKKADGDQDVTSTFTVENAEGKRTITVTRKLDTDGNLVQSTQKLTGTAGGMTFSAERSRTVSPDGSITIISNTKLTIDGQVREVHWEKQVAPDGTFTATGTIKRFDGTTVTKTIALKSTGAEAGTEAIAATDAGAGVDVKLAADSGSGAVTASIDAGAAGQETLKLDADDDDDDEGEVDDDGEDEDEDEEDDDKDDEDEADKPKAVPSATATAAVTASPKPEATPSAPVAATP